MYFYLTLSYTCTMKYSLWAFFKQAKLQYVHVILKISEHFQLIVRMLYNMILLKALVFTSCKFTAEERDAWRRKGRLVCVLIKLFTRHYTIVVNDTSV